MPLPSDAPWRAQIDRRMAAYLVRHVQKTCRIVAEISDKVSRAAPSAPEFNSIRDDLHATILDPLYRAHPALRNAAFPEVLGQKAPRATARDIRPTTASRLAADLTRLQQRISKLAALATDQQADKESAEKALLPFIDAALEFSLAQKIEFDAYPDLAAKNLAAVSQPRTQESDEIFRKTAPPLGSVRLSDQALALVKSFMRQVRRATSQSDQIAWIGWVSEPRLKRPGDVNWIAFGGGWSLGAYARTQVPPDVIDKIRGIDIVFSAGDKLSSLMGKTIDVANRRFFIRD
jgi:hypothetical protein